MVLAWRMRTGLVMNRPYIMLGSAEAFDPKTKEDAEEIIQRKLNVDSVSWTETEWMDGQVFHTTNVEISDNSRWEVQLY